MKDNNTGAFPKGSRCSVPFRDGYRYNGTVRRIGVGKRLVKFDGDREEWVSLQYVDVPLITPQSHNRRKDTTANTLGWVLLILGAVVLDIIAIVVIVAIIACPPLGILGACVDHR